MRVLLTIEGMQRLHIDCKRILGEPEWLQRIDPVWDALLDLAMIDEDILASALLDGMDITTGVHFDRIEAQHLRSLAEYVSRGFVGAEAREGLRILKGKLS